jgi:hypothetical protein
MQFVGGAIVIVALWRMPRRRRLVRYSFDTPYRPAR